MKHTIYTKMLISYLIYGVIAFFIICTFTQHLTTDYIEKQEASNLYRKPPSLQVITPPNTLTHPCRLAISRIT